MSIEPNIPPQLARTGAFHWLQKAGFEASSVDDSIMTAAQQVA